MAIKNDLTNLKFNKLTTLRIGSKTKNGWKWVFKCDCGIEKEILGSLVKHGYIRSCGCLIGSNHIKATSKALNRPKGAAGLDILYCNLKYTAFSRNKTFELSKQDIYDIVTKNCHYCNATPYKKTTINNRKWGLESTKEHGAFIHNGIDRKDSNIGYILDNCIPCCKTCNFMKSILSYKEFLNHIVSIIKHLKINI